MSCWPCNLRYQCKQSMRTLDWSFGPRPFNWKILILDILEEKDSAPDFGHKNYHAIHEKVCTTKFER